MVEQQKIDIEEESTTTATGIKKETNSDNKNLPNLKKHNSKIMLLVRKLKTSTNRATFKFEHTCQNYNKRNLKYCYNSNKMIHG